MITEAVVMAVEEAVADVVVVVDVEIVAYLVTFRVPNVEKIITTVIVPRTPMRIVPTINRTPRTTLHLLLASESRNLWLLGSMFFPRI